MENNKIMALIVVLVVLVVGLSGYIVYDKMLKDKSEKFPLNYEIQNYGVQKDDAPSTITLNKDKTYNFKLNACEGVLTLNGTYTLVDDAIYKTYILNIDQTAIGGFVIPETITLVKINSDTVLMVDQAGCVNAGTTFKLASK